MTVINQFNQTHRSIMKNIVSRLALFAGVMLISSVTLWAQSNQISGNVKSADGDPLVGVNIVVVGTILGTISDIDGNFSFSIPAQWEPEGFDMQLIGKQEGNQLTGTLIYTDGKTYSWTGKPAPELPYNENPNWGKTKKLLNGKNLEGWKAMGENQWLVKDGILTSPKSGSNLVTEEKFSDFKTDLTSMTTDRLALLKEEWQLK